MPYPGSPFRDDLFAGQRVLITGGATGMGKAMAHAFTAHGARVLICSRKEENLKAASDEVLAATGKALLYKTCDVREPDQVAAVMEAAERELGGLDVLVNNAAGNFLVPFDQMSRNAWNAVINIVLNGTFNVTHAAFPLLSKAEGERREAEGGRTKHVLNMVANYAWGAAPLVSHSGAAKAGVLNLTRSLALEWASFGIRVNALAPGPVLTKNASGNLGYADEEGQRRMVDSVPLARMGSAEEMALAALYLSSPAASYITGECLVVDGGQWLRSAMFA